MKSKKLLIIFYRNPELGKVKTQQAATAGDANALAVYLALVAHTRIITETITSDKAVFYSDHIDTEDHWNNLIYKKYLQSGKNLHEKMGQAFAAGFNFGYQSTIIIGTDYFALTESIIHDAFTKLENHAAVVGPTNDGGYYLLGMNKQCDVFRAKHWSANSVCQNIIHDFKKMQLNFAVLQELNKVDEENDLSTVLKPKYWSPSFRSL